MIAWLLETLAGVTLLMLLVLAVRRPVARWFGAGWAYALWALPALRLLLPPLPSFGFEISLPSVALFIPAIDGVAAPLPVSAGPGQWVPFMLALWAGGAVTFLLWHWLAYRSFLKSIKKGARPGDPPFYFGIPTLASDSVDGPLAIGLIDRLIVQPAFFARRYNPDERRLAMEHERIHHVRGDIWWNLAGLLILAFNWFNPVAWLAFRAFRSDQELACDAAVAKHASPDERHDYARALVKSASRPGLIAACPLNSADALKRRLRMMRSHRPGKARAAGGAAALAMLLAGGLLLSSPSRPGEPLDAAPPSAPAAVFAAASAPAATMSAEAPRRHLLPVVRPSSAPSSSLMAAASPSPSVARETTKPRPRLYALPILEDVETIRPVQLATAPARPNVAPHAHQVHVSRIVAVGFQGGVRLTPAGGPVPSQLSAVQVALARAMAESGTAERRERLARAMTHLDRRIEQARQVNSVN